MAFFVRIEGSSSFPSNYMAPTTMVYMNDHTWQNALVTQIATDDQLADNNGDGMQLRMYFKVYPMSGLTDRIMLYTQAYGRGVWVKNYGYSPWPYDTPVFTPTLNQFSLTIVNFSNSYGQEYSIQSFVRGYFTLAYSAIMGREVFSTPPTLSPLAAFTFQYHKGTGPVMYNFPYFIKTRSPPGFPETAGFATNGRRFKATPEGTLVQVDTSDDNDKSTHFKFFPLNGVSSANSYCIQTHYGWYLCITDQGVIESRWAVGPWEQFQLARDWYVVGRFMITKRFENDPYGVYAFRYSNTDLSVSSWLVGSDDMGPYDSFEIEPVSPGFVNN